MSKTKSRKNERKGNLKFEANKFSNFRVSGQFEHILERFYLSYLIII